MSKKKNKSKIIPILIAVAVVFLLLELILLVWLVKKNKAPQVPETPDNVSTAEPEIPEVTEKLPDIEEEISQITTEPTVPETTTAPTIPEKTVEILEHVDNEFQTPYVTLHYPEALADHLVVVNTNASPYTLEFYAMLEDRPEQRIFDLRLGGNIRGNIGMVKTDSGEIPVDLIVYKFTPDESWTEGEINTILAMQEAANDMIEQLDLVVVSENTQQSVEETAPESSVVNMFSINTPYCTLRYPVIWKEYLVTEQTENEEDGICKVMFYGQTGDQEKCLLFTILFGGDEGDQLGVIIGDDGQFITVNIMTEAMDLTGWAEEDSQILYSMQEAVNELIAQLPLE